MTIEELKCPECKSQDLDFIDATGYDLDGSCTEEYKCVDCNCKFTVDTFTCREYYEESIEVIKDDGQQQQQVDESVEAKADLIRKYGDN